MKASSLCNKKGGGEMKKIAVVLIFLSILVLASGEVFAATKERAAQVIKTTTVTQTATAGTQEALADRKAELNGTEWNVQMRPMEGKGKAEADVISFSEDKVMSKNLSNAGFPATNFSVRMQDDGTLTWETMQVSEKEGTAFWRGDIRDGVMTGVLSKRDKKERTVDFNFISTPK